MDGERMKGTCGLRCLRATLFSDKFCLRCVWKDKINRIRMCIEGFKYLWEQD